jgi:hypothetical protein
VIELEAFEREGAIASKSGKQVIPVSLDAICAAVGKQLGES